MGPMKGDARRSDFGSDHSGSCCLGIWGFPKIRGIIMENQMEKKMENEMETGIIQGIIGTRVSQNSGFLFGGPINKDYSILGSRLGSPYFAETTI